MTEGEIMSAEKAKKYLEKYGLADKVRTFEHSSATVELAAQALGCEPARIAKSLTFMVEEKPIMIVAAGDVKIDNHKFKEKFHTKAKMLTPEQVTELVGQKVGGVCPFGINEGVTVYLDDSLKRFETVFPACGESNNAIELTLSELEECSGYTEWVYVGKLPENA